MVSSFVLSLDFSCVPSEESSEDTQELVQSDCLSSFYGWTEMTSHLGLVLRTWASQLLRRLGPVSQSKDATLGSVGLGTGGFGQPEPVLMT